MIKQNIIHGDISRCTRLCNLWYNDIHGPPKGTHPDGQFPMLGLIEKDYVGKVGNEYKTMGCHVEASRLASTVQFRLDSQGRRRRKKKKVKVNTTQKRKVTNVSGGRKRTTGEGY
jgi:hypothetical protein